MIQNLTLFGRQYRHPGAHKLLRMVPGSANACGVLNSFGMKIEARSSLVPLVLLAVPLSASACEPIVPFVKAVGGPGFLTAGFALLGLVVVLKSAAFARFQQKLSFTRALLWMLAANVVTSIVGIVVTAMIDSGAAMFIGIPLVWALCLLPAQRLIESAPVSPLARFTSGQVAFGITLVLIFSYLLLLISRTVHDSDTFFRYWLFKVPTVFVALAVGLVLTAFWEEWIVWRFSRSEDDDFTFVRPVIRSNAIVLAVVMLISVGVMIPKRLRNPDDTQAKIALQSKPAAAKPGPR